MGEVTWTVDKYRGLEGAVVVPLVGCLRTASATDAPCGLCAPLKTCGPLQEARTIPGEWDNELVSCSLLVIQTNILQLQDLSGVSHGLLHVE